MKILILKRYLLSLVSKGLTAKIYIDVQGDPVLSQYTLRPIFDEFIEIFEFYLKNMCICFHIGHCLHILSYGLFF